jgi:hypothetical protein
MRTFGHLSLQTMEYPARRGVRVEKNGFVINDLEPHACIRLKGIFSHLNEGQADNFQFLHTPENCHLLLWFMDLYPLQLDEHCRRLLKRGRRNHLADTREKYSLLTEGYAPAVLKLNEPYEARPYQLKAAELVGRARRLVIADDLGLGKSLTALLVCYQPRALPALVVCKAHLPVQWKEEAVGKFTNLRAHHIKTGKPYKLPPADVYIISYHLLAKWVDVLRRQIRYVIFDEVQELRRCGEYDAWAGFKYTQKYAAAMAICEAATYAVGLSATPIMNYGIEMFNVLECLHPGCLGRRRDFEREWCKGSAKGEVYGPRALGTYLREKFLMVRRTAEEVGLELPKLNVIVKTVEACMDDIEKDDLETQELAISLLQATDWAEQGEMSRELDVRLRRQTGIAKARAVAELVIMLLENGKKVLLSGWHRSVYEIWNKLFEAYNPVMYTGSETGSQKNASKKRFIEETNLMMISNWSGDGLDGLQYVCHYLINGELDWSPQRHEQLAGRLNRPGQTEPVTSIFPVVEYGSDPGIMQVLGLKRRQSDEIIDPLKPTGEQHTDESRIKQMAAAYLHAAGRKVPMKKKQDKQEPNSEQAHSDIAG